MIHKCIPVTYRFIDLTKKVQHSPDYFTINPIHSVPTLIAENGSLKLTQSVTILEYLEKYPEKPLLPKDVGERAIVRNLVNVIANDVQPISNLRILVHVEKLGSRRGDWAKEYLQTGLAGISSNISDYNMINLREAYDRSIRSSC